MNHDWKYDVPESLDQTLVERLKHFPREPDMLCYGLRSLAAVALRCWLRLYHRFSVAGRENLPEQGAYVLVANHSSHLDALALISALPLRQRHRVFPAAAEDYFFKTVPRLWASAVLVNALPFSREIHIRQSLGLCEELLNNPGNVLVIFPEGTRSSDGRIGKFRSGIGMLVAGKNIPVVPCYLEGANAAWPKGRRLPLPRRLKLRIGRPKTFTRYAPGKESACDIAAELKSAVEQLQKDSSRT